MCRPKHVEQLRNTGIISSTTKLHLVGSVYENCITMHGSMNIMGCIYSLEMLPEIKHLEYSSYPLLQGEPLRALGSFPSDYIEGVNIASVGTFPQVNVRQNTRTPKKKY